MPAWPFRDMCKRYFMNAQYFENHTSIKIANKPVCEAKKFCRESYVRRAQVLQEVLFTVSEEEGV